MLPPSIFLEPFLAVMLISFRQPSLESNETCAFASCGNSNIASSMTYDLLIQIVVYWCKGTHSEQERKRSPGRATVVAKVCRLVWILRPFSYQTVILLFPKQTEVIITETISLISLLCKRLDFLWNFELLIKSGSDSLLPKNHQLLEWKEYRKLLNISSWDFFERCSCPKLLYLRQMFSDIVIQKFTVDRILGTILLNPWLIHKSHLAIDNNPIGARLDIRIVPLPTIVVLHESYPCLLIFRSP